MANSTAGVDETTGEKNYSVFKSDGTAGWATMTAEVEGNTASKTILCHRVRIKEFSEPRVLRYLPDSNDDNLAHPKIEFDIEDLPAVGSEFEVKCTIYSLDGHEALANRVWTVKSAGHHSKDWNDFFYPASTPYSEWQGRNLDPGEGIYPYQITATCIKMDRDILADHGIKYDQLYEVDRLEEEPVPTGSDWKASKKLTIKPQRQNAWSLSYDEETDKTKLAYIVDIHSENGKEPQTVRVDVYDPELNKVGEVTNQTIETHRRARPIWRWQDLHLLLQRPGQPRHGGRLPFRRRSAGGGGRSQR